MARLMGGRAHAGAWALLAILLTSATASAQNCPDFGPDDVVPGGTTTSLARTLFVPSNQDYTLGGPIGGYGLAFLNSPGLEPSISVTSNQGVTSASDGLSLMTGGAGSVCYDGLAGGTITVSTAGTTVGLEVRADTGATATVAHSITGAGTGIQMTSLGAVSLTIEDGTIEGNDDGSYGGNAVTLSTDDGSIAVNLNGGTVTGDYYGLFANGDEVSGTGLTVFIDADALLHGGAYGMNLIATSGTMSVLGTGASEAGKGVSAGYIGIVAQMYDQGTVNLGTATQRLGAVTAGQIGIDALIYNGATLNIFTGGPIEVGPSGFGIYALVAGPSNVTIDTAGDITGNTGIFVDLDSDTTGDIFVTTAAGTTITAPGSFGTGINIIREDRSIGGLATGNITILNAANISAPGTLAIGINAAVCDCSSGSLSVTNRGDITAETGIWATASTSVSVQHLAGAITSTGTGILVGGLTTGLAPTVPVSVTVGAGASVAGDVGIGVDEPPGPGGAANPATIVIAGSVIGSGGDAVVLGPASPYNRIELQPGYSVTGTVDGVSPADTLALGGSGSAVFALPLLTTQFTSFEALEKTGTSTFTLTGASAFAGPVSVLGGTLSLGVGASLPSATLTMSGGALAGNGNLGTLVVTGGAVAPGNSIGTINVAGNASFGSGATYAVEVDPTSSDRINAGTATIAGGTVNVAMLAGTYALNQQYTIIATTGGRTGTFGGVSVSSAFFTPSLTYDANNVFLNLARNTTTLVNVAQTPNQAAVAAAVDGAGAGAPYLSQLLVLDAAQARSALDGLSGEIHASLLGGFMDTDQFRTAALDRAAGTLDAIPAVAPSGYVAADATPAGPGNGLWGRAYGSKGSLLATANAATLNFAEGGLFAGADAPVGPAHLGAIAGLGLTRMEVPARSSTASSTDLSIGVYGAGGGDAGMIKFGAGYVHHLVSTTRATGIPGVADTLNAGYWVGTAQAFAEASGRLDLGAQAILPFAGAAALYEMHPGFTETGGAGALAVGAGSYSALVGTMGIRLEHQFAFGDGGLGTARASAAWKHVAAADPRVSSSFGGGAPFVVSGVGPVADALVVSGELGFDLPTAVNLDLAYRGQFAPGGISQSATATLAASF